MYYFTWSSLHFSLILNLLFLESQHTLTYTEISVNNSEKKDTDLFFFFTCAAFTIVPPPLSVLYRTKDFQILKNKYTLLLVLLIFIFGLFWGWVKHFWINYFIQCIIFLFHLLFELWIFLTCDLFSSKCLIKMSMKMRPSRDPVA